MFSDRFATDKMTVYGFTTNNWGEETFTLKGVIACEYEQGGSMQRDQNGDQFVPMSTFYPVASSIVIERGDKIALGDTSSGSVPNTAEEVKKVSRSSGGYFGWSDEMVVYTG
ncbi:MAG: hypothetical protein ACPHUL_00835 [Marinomonas gallaica]